MPTNVRPNTVGTVTPTENWNWYGGSPYSEFGGAIVG